MSKRILGIIGALLGGFLFTIPWILLYVYGKMLFSILAAFIAFGALLGYKKFGGTVDKKTPIIIVIVSLIVIVVTTLIIIPLCLLYQNGFIVSWHNLEFIYNNLEFKEAIIHDLIISVFFTLLGISGVISKLKQEVDPNYVSVQANNIANNQNNIEMVKQAFMKYHAMDKFNATSKENILGEINNDLRLFKQLKMQQIIKKYRGNYYFNEKAEKSLLYRFAILYLKIMGIIILLVAIVLLIMFITTK